MLFDLDGIMGMRARSLPSVLLDHLGFSRDAIAMRRLSIRKDMVAKERRIKIFVVMVCEVDDKACLGASEHQSFGRGAWPSLNEHRTRAFMT